MTDNEKFQERGFFALLVLVVVVALGAMWFHNKRAECRTQFADRSVEEIILLCK
jgi:high-affinity Fe2+/Pb2+ permease